MAFSINFPSAEVVRIFSHHSHTWVWFLIRWCSAFRAGAFCSRFHPSAFSPTQICQTVRTCLWAICLSSFVPTAHHLCVFKAQSEATFLSLKQFLPPSIPDLVLRPFLSPSFIWPQSPAGSASASGPSPPQTWRPHSPALRTGSELFRVRQRKNERT